MSNSVPSYSAEVAQPFRDELTAVNFKELRTPAEVDAALNRQDDKIVLVVLNSVCGCAARSARPGTILSMLNNVSPDEYATVFAGMEKDAVAHFRQKYLPGLTPSSPNIALFKNGELLHILQRYQVRFDPCHNDTIASLAGQPHRFGKAVTRLIWLLHRF